MNKKDYDFNDLPLLFNKGTKFRVHGWIMLKGVSEGDYEVIESTDKTVKFSKLLRSGKLPKMTTPDSYKRKGRHFYKSQLFSHLNTFLHGSLNGIEIL